MQTLHIISLFCVFLLIFSPMLSVEGGHIDFEKHGDYESDCSDTSASFGTLSYEPISYNFTEVYPDVIVNTTFEIWNSGCCSLIYSILEDCPWVFVHPTHGVSSGEWDHHVINVTINTTDLSFGHHTCDIIIDTNDVTGIFTVAVTVIPYPNHTPHVPTLIGPDRSEPSESVVFEAKTTDPDDDVIYYQWNFNEENITAWMGPYESNDVCYIEYEWEEEGNYLVKVRAKDEHGNTTEWSQHVIQVPHTKVSFSIIEFIMQFFLKISPMFPFL